MATPKKPLIDFPTTPNNNLPSYAQGPVADTGYGIGTYGYLEDAVNDPRFKVQVKAPYKEEIVTRKTVWDYYRTSLLLPQSSEVLQKLNANIEEVDQLLCDGRVKAAYNNRRAGCMSLKWTIDQNQAPSRAFKVIKRVFEELPVYDVISGMLMAPLYGYNVTEVIWSVDSGMVLPSNVQEKAQRWFGYDDKNQLRYKTKMNQVQGEPLPPRKFLVTRFHPRYDDPYASREALFNALYWPVKFRHLLLEYGTQFCEKYGSPWLDVEMEAGMQQDRLQEILNVLQNTYNDGIIAHPASTKITALNIGDTKNVKIYTEWMDVLNREIDMAILGNNLSAEIQGGSFAAARSLMGVREDVIKEDARMIEESMNQLIEWVCWYNFGSGIALPKFRMYKSEPATLERAQIDQILQSNLGVKFSKEYITRTYGVNDDEFELAIPVAPEQELTDVEGGQIRTAGIEAKDQSTNTSTVEAMDRASEKGIPY